VSFRLRTGCDVVSAGAQQRDRPAAPSTPVARASKIRMIIETPAKPRGVAAQVCHAAAGSLV